MPNTTSRRLLTQAKPSKPCRLKSRFNSKGDWPRLDAATIKVWKEFSLENLDKSYGHILDLRIPEQEVPTVPKASQILATVSDIVCPSDISYLTLWNCKIIEETARFAKNCLHIEDGVALHHRYAARDKSCVAKIPGNTMTPRPIGVSHLISLDEYPPANLVVGLGRPSCKFQARSVANRPGTVSRNGLWPLKQLAEACKVAMTKYGYTLTDEDFLACCFSRTETDDSMSVSLMLIPRSRYGESQLTTDLALWWLTMLALSAPVRRMIVKEEDVVPINTWDHVCLDDERGWVRRHRYSKVDEPADPPPSPDYCTPASDDRAGQMALVEAHLGMHLDPDFDIHSLDFNIDSRNFDDLNHFLYPDS